MVRLGCHLKLSDTYFLYGNENTLWNVPNHSLLDYMQDYILLFQFPISPGPIRQTAAGNDFSILMLKDDILYLWNIGTYYYYNVVYISCVNLKTVQWLLCHFKIKLRILVICSIEYFPTKQQSQWNIHFFSHLFMVRICLGFSIFIHRGPRYTDMCYPVDKILCADYRCQTINSLIRT